MPAVVVVVGNGGEEEKEEGGDMSLESRPIGPSLGVGILYLLLCSFFMFLTLSDKRLRKRAI